MTPAELHSIAVALNGGREYGSQKRLAELLGVSTWTVRRWMGGDNIPEPMQRLIRAIAAKPD